MNTVEAAISYIRRGYRVTPIRPGEKRPTADDWHKRIITAAGAPVAFGSGEGVGLVLGRASGGLIDIDLDSDEAQLLAPKFLPQTFAVTGRPSRPRTHWWYICPDGRSRRFREPTEKGGPPGRMLFEARYDGHQTVVGPSVHPSGEQYDVLVSPPSVVFWWSLYPRLAALYRAITGRAYTALKKTENASRLLRLSNSNQTLSYRRAEQYAAATPGAVSGQGGHNTTFKLAIALVHGFGLSDDRALDILRVYNERCVPEWSERELIHKIRSAAEAEPQHPRLWLLTRPETRTTDETGTGQTSSLGDTGSRNKRLVMTTSRP